MIPIGRRDNPPVGASRPVVPPLYGDGMSRQQRRSTEPSESVEFTDATLVSTVDETADLYRVESRHAATEHGYPVPDLPRAAAAIRELLLALGEDPDREGLRETPARVARAYAEMFAGRFESPEAVLATGFDLGHRELVLVKDIELYSICEHHLVPFHGVAHVGYIPSATGRITGLSKLARLVELYARRPQIQERLTSEIADALVEHLHPSGVIVVVEAEHLCMSMRGVRKPGSRTVTSAVRGQMRNPATRAEAMSLIVSK